MKNKKLLAGFVMTIGSVASLITSIIMTAKKRRELGGFFLGLGLITGVIGAYMQFEGKHSELLTQTCGCGDPDCEDCCDNDPEQQEDCDIDEGELFSRDGE